MNRNRVQTISRDSGDDELENSYASTQKEFDIQSSDDKEDLTAAEEHSMYCKFYANMGDDELDNLDNYLKRE